jgi:hypothetical protein
LKSKLIACCFLLPLLSYGQPKDSTVSVAADTAAPLPKKKKFAFITNLPSDLGKTVTVPFNRKSIKTTAILGAVSAAIILVDQDIYNGVRNFSDNIHLHPEESNKVLWSIKSGDKETVLFKVPENLNTAFYTLGQGFTSLLLAGGLAIDGVISKHPQSLQTASDLTESFIALGVSTQFLKYATGRENPAVFTQRNGRWRPFPSYGDFQNDKPKYDAFPSGHLATLMATITILADNYPNKKWIKPVGYSLMTLSAFSMINNGVHWAGDYPIGIGIGYLTAKIITKRHTLLAKKTPVLIDVKNKI